MAWSRESFLTQNLLIDPLTLNFGFTGLAVVIGWLILQVLTFIESVTWGRGGLELIAAVPLFPMALVGGIIIQLVMRSLGLDSLIMRRLQERIAGVALDVVVVTAIATIALTVIGANLGAFIILAVAGIIWNILAFIYIAPRILLKQNSLLNRHTRRKRQWQQAQEIDSNLSICCQKLTQID